MTNINSKLFFLVEKKKQERAKELELKNNPEVVEEEISEGVKAVRIMAEAKKEEPIEVIRELSDEEVLARMAAEEEPSIIDKIKDTLITRNAEATAPAEKPARKPRAPRKKAVVPNFVIQNSADDGITYASVVEKVQAAVTIKDVTSLDIYVKAEEGKAYYVVNGEAAGAVDLF